ncbi:MAG: DNA helicase UvrD, partial [Planctomycetes bacterium]|nr:DNA helicase UvrD [Planctomycetota bacterium]
MTYVADLHLHSPFAIATSKQLNLENLARWARIKGIDLLASADFTHPLWFDETKAKLRETGDGLLALRKAPDSSVRFVLGTEVNCNGQQGGRNRRVHM